MRLWIFLKLMFKDLAIKLWTTLYMGLGVAIAIGCFVGAMFGIGWTLLHIAPQSWWMAVFDGLGNVKSYNAYLLGDTPFEFPCMFSLGLLYAAIIGIMVGYVLVMCIVGPIKWMRGLWRTAGYEADNLRRLKKAAVALLVGCAAAAAVFFGTGCSRVRSQERAREQFPAAQLESVPGQQFGWLALVDGTNLYYFHNDGFVPNSSSVLIPLFGAPPLPQERIRR